MSLYERTIIRGEQFFVYADGSGHGLNAEFEPCFDDIDDLFPQECFERQAFQFFQKYQKAWLRALTAYEVPPISAETGELMELGFDPDGTVMLHEGTIEDGHGLLLRKWQYASMAVQWFQFALISFSLEDAYVC